MHKAIDVKAGREQISTEYEKGIVSGRFDHGRHGGLLVETETKGNTRPILKANCGHRFLKKSDILKGMKFVSLK